VAREDDPAERSDVPEVIGVTVGLPVTPVHGTEDAFVADCAVVAEVAESAVLACVALSAVPAVFAFALMPRYVEAASSLDKYVCEALACVR